MRWAGDSGEGTVPRSAAHRRRPAAVGLAQGTGRTRVHSGDPALPGRRPGASRGSHAGDDAAAQRVAVVRSVRYRMPLDRTLPPRGWAARRARDRDGSPPGPRLGVPRLGTKYDSPARRDRPFPKLTENACEGMFPAARRMSRPGIAVPGRGLDEPAEKRGVVEDGVGLAVGLRAAHIRPS